jgi:hypothetical protein
VGKEVTGSELVKPFRTVAKRVGINTNRLAPSMRGACIHLSAPSLSHCQFGTSPPQSWLTRTWRLYTRGDASVPIMQPTASGQLLSSLRRVEKARGSRKPDGRERRGEPSNAKQPLTMSIFYSRALLGFSMEAPPTRGVDAGDGRRMAAFIMSRRAPCAAARLERCHIHASPAVGREPCAWPLKADSRRAESRH